MHSTFNFHPKDVLFFDHLAPELTMHDNFQTFKIRASPLLNFQFLFHISLLRYSWPFIENWLFGPDTEEHRGRVLYQGLSGQWAWDFQEKIKAMVSAGNISPVNIIFFKRPLKETFPLFLREPNTQNINCLILSFQSNNKKEARSSLEKRCVDKGWQNLNAMIFLYHSWSGYFLRLVAVQYEPGCKGPCNVYQFYFLLRKLKNEIGKTKII